MDEISQIRRAVVLAPHADDEVLGCGGTIARLSKRGAEVHVVIVTRGQEPDFPAELVDQILSETKAAHARLGVRETHMLSLPAAGLDTLPAAAVNRKIAECLDRIEPDTIFIPFVGDIHLDHQIVFTSSLVWARPRSSATPSRVLAYETLSETNWYAPGTTITFSPNVFIDISEHLDDKVDAFGMFRSQVKTFPDERSPESIRALARVRGAAAYCRAAEAFVAIRQIWK